MEGEGEEVDVVVEGLGGMDTGEECLDPCWVKCEFVDGLSGEERI